MKNEKTSAQEHSMLRPFAEWLLILGIPAVLYLTGWHAGVAGRLQQAVLWTGLFQPEIVMDEEARVKVDYDMPLRSFQGESLNFSRFKGKVIFLNFWATWCPPCIAEMPNIQSLYEKFKHNNGIVFVMISLDEDMDKARNFLKRKEFSFPAFQLNGRRPGLFKTAVIPATYIINSRGTLVAKREGMANYNSASVQSFLKNQLQAENITE